MNSPASSNSATYAMAAACDSVRLTWFCESTPRLCAVEGPLSSSIYGSQAGLGGVGIAPPNCRSTRWFADHPGDSGCSVADADSPQPIPPLAVIAFERQSDLRRAGARPDRNPNSVRTRPENVGRRQRPRGERFGGLRDSLHFPPDRLSFLRRTHRQGADVEVFIRSEERRVGK